MEKGWRKNYLRYKTFFLNMLTQYRERSDWKAYIEILLSLATVSIFSVFALRPTLVTIAGLVKEIDEKKVTVNTMDAKIQNLSKAQTIFDQEGGRIQLLENFAIPKRENSDVFARQIENLSNKHQVALSTFSLGEGVILGKQANTSSPKEDKENSNPMPEGASQITFSISAQVGIDQYPALVGFLSDFENLRRPQKLDEVKISLQKEETQEQTSEIKLVLTISGKLPYLVSPEIKR